MISWLIGNRYRPPFENNSNSNVKNFIQQFNPVIDKISRNNSHAIILVWVEYKFTKTTRKGEMWIISWFEVHIIIITGEYPSNQNHPMEKLSLIHYNGVIMTMMASQITSLTIVYSIVYSGINQRKHQSSASPAFVRGIQRWPVNSPHKWPVTRKMFPLDDVIMYYYLATIDQIPESHDAPIP